MAKTKSQKRQEALERAKDYTWERSKAKRLGTLTKEQWLERNDYAKHYSNVSHGE